MEFSQQRKEDGARTSPSGEADDDDVRKELLHKRAGGDNNDEDDVDDEGTRQPYKCTFCRRGFPTAQALGGHMNVHRRHRGRATSAAVAASAQASSSSCYEQYSTTAPVVAFGQTHPVSGMTAMATGGTLLQAERPPHELRLFGRDCAAAPGKQGGAGDRRDHQCYSKDGDGDHGGGEELDLELRLGSAAS